MADNKFSIKEAFDYAWGATRANFLFLLAALILGYAAAQIPNVFAEYFQKRLPLLAFVFGLGAFVLNFLTQLGWIRIALLLHDGQKAGIEELFCHWRLVLRFIGASICYGLAVLGGFVLLIVPGVIMMTRLSLFYYLIVDQDAGAMDSLRRSWELTRGQTGKLLLLGLAILGVNLLGMLCLFVGLLWTCPLSMMVAVYVYRRFVPASLVTVS